MPIEPHFIERDPSRLVIRQSWPLRPRQQWASSFAEADGAGTTTPTMIARQLILVGPHLLRLSRSPVDAADSFARTPARRASPDYAERRCPSLWRPTSGEPDADVHVRTSASVGPARDRALADTIEAGKQPPKPKHEAKARQQLENLRRSVDAAATLEGRMRIRLNKAIEKERQQDPARRRAAAQGRDDRVLEGAR